LLGHDLPVERANSPFPIYLFKIPRQSQDVQPPVLAHYLELINQRMHSLTAHLMAAGERLHHSVLWNSVNIYVWQPLCVFDEWSTWVFSGGRDGRDSDETSPSSRSSSANSDAAKAKNGSDDAVCNSSRSDSYSFCTEDGEEYGAMTSSEDGTSVEEEETPLRRELTNGPSDSDVLSTPAGQVRETVSLAGDKTQEHQPQPQAVSNEPVVTPQQPPTVADNTMDDADEKAAPAGIPVVKFREALESVDVLAEIEAARLADEAEAHAHDLSRTARSNVAGGEHDDDLAHEGTLGNTLGGTFNSVASFAQSGDTRQAAREAIRAINLKNVRKLNQGKVRALGSEQWATLIAVPDAIEWLSGGNGLFSFACRPGDKLHPDAKESVAAMINLSSFSDELKENNAPAVHMDSAEVEKLKFIVVKATYALPGVDYRKLTPELLSSNEYHEHCQPGKPKIETKMALPPNTFRLTKTIISWVLSVVIQLKVSRITDKATLRQLSCIDGLVPSYAILMERTKRDVSKHDSTLKVKSLLLYHRVAPASCIVTNFSVVVNSSLPSAAATIVNTFGSKGAEEVRETMVNTRKYLVDTFGDARPRRKSFRRMAHGGSFKEQPAGANACDDAESHLQG
jgi:hypothetical protein